MSSYRPRLLQVMLSTQEGGAETFFEKLAFGFDARDIEQHLVIEPFPTREARLASLKNAGVGPIRFGGAGRLVGGPAAEGGHQPISSRRRAHVDEPGLPPRAGRADLPRGRTARRLLPPAPLPALHAPGGHHARSGGPHHPKRLAGRPIGLLIPNFGETPDGVGDAGGRAAATAIRIGGARSETPLLVALGRLHEVKAHDTLLRALAAVPGRAHLMIAGEGPLDGRTAEPRRARWGSRSACIFWAGDGTRRTFTPRPISACSRRGTSPTGPW